MATSLDFVVEGEKAFADLYDRMDKDARLAYLNPFTLTYADGTTIPGAISVTMNDPAIFLNAVVSWIMNARWQIVVEGDISARQERYIEGFLEDKDAEADEIRQGTGLPNRKTFLASHICARGWIIERHLWIEDMQGNPKLYVLPLDMRYCCYEMGTDGYNWVSNRTWRDKALIKQEYGIDVYGNKSEIQVVDYWDSEKEDVWIDNKLVKTSPHRLGYPPFVIMAAPQGFMLLDKGYIVHKGESVFFLDRDLYPEYNRLISIDQTMALKALSPPMQRPTNDTVPSPYPDEAGTVYDVTQNELYQPIPRQDIQMANRVAHSDIGSALQRGGINNIDLGNLTQPTSAIWITEQAEIRNKIVQPRLDALADFFDQCARMDIDQYQKGEWQGKVGRRGKAREYSAKILGDPETYRIEYVGMSRSKKQEIANMALFNASAGLSLKTRLKDILLHEDPEGEMARIDAEKAEQADPALFFLRKARSLAQEAEQVSGVEADQMRLESRLLTQRGVALIKERRVPAPPSTPPPATNALLPLLGESGMRGRAATTMEPQGGW